MTYTLAKSRDDASSVGGGGTVVAQNDQDLGAEWGLSSFDRRHQLTADFSARAPVRREQTLAAQRRSLGWRLRQLARLDDVRLAVRYAADAPRRR